MEFSAFLLGRPSSLYILDTRPLAGTCFVDIFVIGNLSFCFLNNGLFFHFERISLSTVSSVAHAFVSFKNHGPVQGHEGLPGFLPAFGGFALTFRLLTHFKLLCI